MAVQVMPDGHEFGLKSVFDMNSEWRLKSPTFGVQFIAGEAAKPKPSLLRN